MTKQIIGELECTEKFIPQLEERYYFVNEYGVVEFHCYQEDGIDERIIKHSLVFRERRDCRIYGRYLKLLNEYTFEPDWKDVKSCKYHIIYNHDMKEIECDVEFGMQYQGFYFETLDKLNEFIEKAGEQNIKRFMFDVWE